MKIARHAKSSSITLLLFSWVAVSVFSAAAPSHGGSSAVFERLGPHGGTVRSLLISSVPDVVYMGTVDGQMFKSTDGGRKWRLLYPGIQRRQFVIDTVAEDPVDSAHLYLGGWDVRSSGGGLFESLDAGMSWIPVALPKQNVGVRGFAISARNPQSMIVATNAGVFVSSNGGKAWHQVGARLDAFLQAESVAIDPDRPEILFVGTWHLGYRSSDFGKTWVQNQEGMILDSDVFSIAIDERNSKNMYASACTGLYRSTNQGISWTRLKVFPTSFLVRAQVVYLDPVDSNRVYGGTTEGLFVSANSGKSWERVTPADWIINSIQVDPRSGTILVGTERFGVVRSEDGGKTWAESNQGYGNRSISRIIADSSGPGRFYVGEVSEGKTGGFYIYDNPINDWVPVKKNEIPGEGLLSMLALPDKSRIAGTARGAFVWRPESEKWEPLAGPIGRSFIYDLVFDKTGKWIFAGTNNGVLRASVDDLIFKRPRNYAVIPRVYSLFSAQNTVLFAASHVGVLRSENNAETWTASSAGIPDSALVECVIASPGDSNRLFAGTTAGLFYSKDGGRNWGRLADGRLQVDVASVIFLNSSGTRLAAADNTFGGILLSEDGGIHWEKIENPQFSSPIRSMAQDPLHQDILYLGTASEGVYRLTLPAKQ